MISLRELSHHIFNYSVSHFSYLVPDVYICSCLHQQFDTLRETMPRHLVQRSVPILKRTSDIPIINYYHSTKCTFVSKAVLN